MTNSTAAFLHTASTLTDPISCCTAYIASSNGLLHAGAVDLAYNSLARLGTPDKVSGLIADVKAKKCRLFRYGYPFYKTVDPRTKFIRAILDELSESSKDNPLLAVALETDRIASKDIAETEGKCRPVRLLRLYGFVRSNSHCLAVSIHLLTVGYKQRLRA